MPTLSLLYIRSNNDYKVCTQRQRQLGSLSGKRISEASDEKHKQMKARQRKINIRNE